MPLDPDTLMLERLGYAVVDLQVKYRTASLAERVVLRPKLDELLESYADYQLKLLRDGVITTDAELQEMEAIRAEIEQAAAAQQVLAALVRTAVFVAARV